MTYTVFQAQGGPRDRMRNPVDTPRTLPPTACCCFLHIQSCSHGQMPHSEPNSPLSPMWATLSKVTKVYKRISKTDIWQRCHWVLLWAAYLPCGKAPSYQFLHKHEPVCSSQTAALAAQFPHFLKLFVFYQSGAHFASPWQTRVYFLLGFHTCGSQMKGTAPQESFEFHQPVDEVILHLSVRFLRDFISLIEEVKVQKRRSEKKSSSFASFEKYFWIHPSNLPPSG